MANYLGMAQVHAIQVLRGRGWSFRRIARELGVHRETVARYVRLAEAGDGVHRSPDGSDSKPAKPAHRVSVDMPADQLAGSGPRSKCEPFRETIQTKLDQGLSYQRIWQDLHYEHGFAGGYDSVKRFGRRLIRARPLPFRRMERAPGDEAQIDFGKGAPVLKPNGQRKRPHLFRIVLSHSRKGYSEVVWRQDTETFIRALENAFHHFGGVPKSLVPDNLKAAVIKADWYDPDLNPKIQSFCEHYHSTILPTRPKTPRHKGKIERQVGYAQDNGLKGLEFASLQDQNGHLLEWETHVADTRIHGTTRKQVGKVFTEVERPALLPLPLERFPFFHEAERIVHRDGHVEVDRGFYSVPPEYLRRKVWARWDSRVVRIFDHRLQQIAVHTKGEPGRFRTQPEHIAPEKISGVERGARWWLERVRLIGPGAETWARSMMTVRGIQGMRVLMGLMDLSKRHPIPAIEDACRIAQTHGAYHLRVIRALIKRKGAPQEQFEFIDQHPIIRRLSDYGDLVGKAFQEA